MARLLMYCSTCWTMSQKINQSVYPVSQHSVYNMMYTIDGSHLWQTRLQLLMCCSTSWADHQPVTELRKITVSSAYQPISMQHPLRTCSNGYDITPVHPVSLHR